MQDKYSNITANLTFENVPDDPGNIYQLMFIFWGVIIPVIGVFGIVGNILSGIVLFRQEMKTSTVYFLRVLVITDTGIITGAIIGLSIISITQIDPKKWLFTDVIYPKIFTPVNFFLMTFQTLNVWTTVAMSVQRYIAISFPFRYVTMSNKRNTYIVIGVTTVFAVAYNIPRCFATEFTSCGSNCFVIVNTDFGRSEFYTVIYSQWLYTILMFVVPLSILFILNTLLVIKLTQIRRRRRNMSINAKEITEFNLSIVLVIIVAVFILCQTPGLVAQFKFLDWYFLLIWTCVSNMLFVLNSSVNFLIYTTVGSKFRTILVKIIKR